MSCHCWNDPAFDLFLGTLGVIFGVYDDRAGLDALAADGTPIRHSWGDFCRSPSSELMDAIWQPISASEKLPQIVKNFLRADMLRRLVHADLRNEALWKRPTRPSEVSQSRVEWAESPAQDPAEDYESRCPEDFNQRLLRKLADAGEQAQADELRDQPARFWNSYRDGWTEASSAVWAHYDQFLDPWMRELVSAANACVTWRTSSLAMKQTVPKLVVDAVLCVEPPEIWLRPDIPDHLGSLPVNVDIEWATMDVDAKPLFDMCDRLYHVRWFEHGPCACYPGLTIVGRWRGHYVEIGFMTKPRILLPYCVTLD